MKSRLHQCVKCTGSTSYAIYSRTNRDSLSHMRSLITHTAPLVPCTEHASTISTPLKRYTHNYTCIDLAVQAFHQRRGTQHQPMQQKMQSTVCRQLNGFVAPASQFSGLIARFAAINILGSVGSIAC